MVTLSIAGMNCLGMFVPVVKFSNSIFVFFSGGKGYKVFIKLHCYKIYVITSTYPETFPYWPWPPDCFLCK